MLRRLFDFKRCLIENSRNQQKETASMSCKHRRRPHILALLYQYPGVGSRLGFANNSVVAYGRIVSLACQVGLTAPSQKVVRPVRLRSNQRVPFSVIISIRLSCSIFSNASSFEEADTLPSPVRLRTSFTSSIAPSMLFC